MLYKSVSFPHIPHTVTLNTKLAIVYLVFVCSLISFLFVLFTFSVVGFFFSFGENGTFGENGEWRGDVFVQSVEFNH